MTLLTRLLSLFPPALSPLPRRTVKSRLEGVCGHCSPRAADCVRIGEEEEEGEAEVAENVGQEQQLPPPRV